VVKPTLASESALGRVLSSADITIIDGGARGKARAELRELAPVATCYAFEPDVEEARQLESAWSAVGWRAYHVIPEALGAKDGQAVLHVQHRAAGSSLREPDMRAMSAYANTSQMGVCEQRVVNVITLDSAAARSGFLDATLLKLDTPGVELEVLQGGQKLVSQLVAVAVETHLQPLYKGAALFADVDTYLRGAGFELFELRRSLWRGANYRVDRASRMRPISANCLYLARPDAVAASRDPRRIARLLAVALAFRQFDLAYRLVESDPTAAILRDAAGGDLTLDLDALVPRITDEQLAKMSPKKRTRLTRSFSKDS
jgi:FkbM family methyltransferase